jgi:chromosome segregation ATPase
MAVDVGAITLKLKAAEVACGKYDAASKELDGRMKRLMGEFQLINQGLWEGRDHIKELEAELAAAKETFAKMAGNKLGPIKKNLSDLGQTAGNTAMMASNLEKEVKTLHKAVDTATGDVAKKKAAYDMAKKLETASNRAFVQLNNMRQEVAGLAKAATL